VWPNDLVWLRWAFVIASLASAGQSIPTFLSHWKDTEAQFGVYLDALMLFLTCGVCAFAWARSLRGFVLLAVASQWINGFMALGRVLYYLALLPQAQRAKPDFLHEFVWELIALTFAATVAAYLTPRYVLVRMLASGDGPPAWPKDLVTLRRIFLVASLASVGQAISVARASSAHPFGVYYVAVMLCLTCGASALAWATKVRGFVLIALASQLINGFVTVGFVLIDGTALFEVPSRHLLGNVSWDLIVIAFAFTIVAYLTPRYLSVGARTSTGPATS
jgi:hypothetical protein